MLLAFSGWTRKQRKIVSHRGLFKQYIEYLYKIKSYGKYTFKDVFGVKYSYREKGYRRNNNESK